MAKFTGHTITPDSALGGIQLEKSLRFDDDQSSPTRLTRTIQSGGNRKKFTLSVWVKRSQLGSTSYSNSSGNSGQSILHTVGQSNRGWIRFNSDDTLGFDQGNDSQSAGNIDTVAKYRDVTSWYHLVFVADYANSTAADRAKIYVNGVQQEVTTTTSFLQDTDGEINANDVHEIGFSEYGQGYTGSSWWFNFFCGYMSEFHFVDGQSYDPTYFGFTDAQTGQWRPKKYEGTHGTTGWYLPFTDNSSTSALGKDNSGNANDWTVNGFSVSAGVDNDSLLDNPTNNFCILNYLATKSGNVTLSNGNLDASFGTVSGGGGVVGTFAVSSGKWYWETTITAASGSARITIGVVDDTFAPYSGSVYYEPGLTSASYGYVNSGTKYNNNTDTSYGASYTTNDVIGVALDLDNGTITFYKNNSSQGQAFSGLTGGFLPAIGDGSSAATHSTVSNFGQRAFSYTPPTGYRALNSKNLATPNAAAVVKPQRHFECLTWDGNSTQDRNITGLEFKPDMIWIKSYTHSTYGGGLVYHHLIWDVLRGVGSNTIGASSRKELTVNDSYEEGRGANYTDYYGHVSSFNENGFQLDHVSGEPPFYTNQTGRSYVAWCWKAGGAGVANSDGSISSTVSVNDEAGFSMLLYTGTGSSATVGHGLNDTPEMIWTKSRSASGSWAVLDTVGNTTAEYGLFLNDNGGYSSYQGGTYWSDTLPTSSVFTVNSNAATNASGVTYIAYCWRSIPGYSKIGKYTGNASTDGTYVHLGFRPAFVLLKRTSASASWVLHDNKRSGHNGDNDYLHPDNTQSQSDGSSGTIDFLANGFKLRMTAGTHNDGTFIYMAFAERPSGTMFGLDANAR